MKLKKTADKIYENDGNMPVVESVPKEYKLVLDIGFGNGANAKKLISSGHIVDGVTLSPIEVEASEGVIRKIFIHNLEEGLPATITDKYDAIICSHVLEHVAYPEKLLKDIHNCLTPQGIVVVALPNVMNYRSRWELAKGNFHTKETGIWDNTHLRWYTFTSAQKLFTEHSFSVVKAWVSGDLPWLTVLKSYPSFHPSKAFQRACYYFKGSVWNPTALRFAKSFHCLAKIVFYSFYLKYL